MGFQGLSKTSIALQITLKPLTILFGKAKTEDSKMYKMLHYFWVRIKG